MNSLPVVTIKPEKGGWSATCKSCDWFAWDQRRPVIDKQAHEHQGKCRPRVDAAKQAPKARPRADWSKREDSTWIDRL